MFTFIFKKVGEKRFSSIFTDRVPIVDRLKFVIINTVVLWADKVHTEVLYVIN